MSAAGMICEYNPLHTGHIALIEEARRRLGPESAVVVCMSGDFVQRGGFAVVGRAARAEAAVRSGADLVLELPLPWAVSSAEGFAAGGVGILHAAGVVDYLLFGSESGDTDGITETARLLLRPDFPEALRRELTRGDTFPAARARAAQALAESPELRKTAAAVLSRPNDLLGVEYVKALLQSGSRIRPFAVLRRGAAHGDTVLQDGKAPSSTAIRALLQTGQREAALSAMAPAMRETYQREEAAGRAPVFWDPLERAVLYRLRSMNREDFAVLDGGHEGLYHRLYKASRDAVSVQEVLDRAKTRRYPLSRLRRCILWAFLGLTERPDTLPYLRPLAMRAAGRELLAQMRKRAALPVLSKPEQLKTLPPAAQSLFAKEEQAEALYALAFPNLAASQPSLRKRPPFFLPDSAAVRN